MPLAWNEIRDRAVVFAREWKDAASEHADAQTFWNEFFEVFGVRRKRVATFERLVELPGGRKGYPDLLWKGKLLIEHKSRGRDLEGAYRQAREYSAALEDYELPDYILLCDFDQFRLIDLSTQAEHTFQLKDFPKHIRLFAFIAGYETQTYRELDPLNIDAAKKMGLLHDELKASGYRGHDLEVLLVRLLFCLFADDTGIFNPGSFRRFIEERTAQDGSDLGARLNELFDVLDQPQSERQSNLDIQLSQFDWINGKLFAGRLRTASFSRAMRTRLLDCANIDWSAISPAIFGAMFQYVMDDKARRNLGGHYTSETNILKVIRPLFLDDLRKEFERTKTNSQLVQFHDKLRGLNFLDPACGCGNFLVVAYREIRLLELDVLRLLRDTRQLDLDIRNVIRVNVDQFFGIELEEFPAQIAQVALWLVDHQMNTLAGEEFGQPLRRIPLKTSPHIVHGNALQMEWKEVVPKAKLNYIFGNPPFIGSKFLNTEQRNDMALVFRDVRGAGVLDYVTAWYIKAAHFIQGSRIQCAFVSTNSITQGEQVGILWKELLRLGIKINFAHRTFMWRNEAPGMAAVHCVIIGFAAFEAKKKTIFDYSDIRGEAHATLARNINPYLVDAPDVLLPSRAKPFDGVPRIGIGNKPIDDGNYLFTPEERDEFIQREPESAKWFRRWIGSDEFLYGYDRWCLWLGDCPPNELRQMPLALKRVEAVRKFREESVSAGTRRIAETPTRFHVENMPKSNYLVIPEVSSERRRYIPIGFEGPKTLASNLVKIVPNATLYHFGVLQSEMHMAWVRYTCGRLESRYRYSKDIVYNNFPWPNPSEKQKQAIESAAQEVLDARKEFPDSSLADLYDPRSMPAALLKAHRKLDKAVDAAYGKKDFPSDSERAAFLFERYRQVTAPLIITKEIRSKIK